MRQPLWAYLDSITIRNSTDLLRTWQDQLPGAGVLALVCEQESDAVSLLQQVASSVGMVLVGAVVPGLVVMAGFQRKGALLFAVDASIPCRILNLPRVEGHTALSAVEALASFVEHHAAEEGEDTLLLFLDGLTPDAASLLDRLYLEIGDRVRFAGASVGSESFRAAPCLFDNDSFLQDAVLALLLPRNAGPALAHHYCGNDALRVATDIAGNRIKAINGRLAFDVYRDLMKSEYGIDLDRENFYDYAVHFPFAFNRISGEPLVRIPVAVEDDGSILCIGEVPENALLGVVCAIEAGNLAAAQAVGKALRTDCARGVMVFYCAGRFLHQGEAAAVLELTALAATVAPLPLFGVLSLGEIANTWQQEYPQFCNATIVALPWQ